MTAERSARYLTIRILYPKPGKTDDILAAVERVSAAAREFEGLVEIGAWLDKDIGNVSPPRISWA